MDRIINRIIPFKKPKEYIFWGENYLDIYKQSNGRIQMARRIEEFDLLESREREILQLEKYLSHKELGIILNAKHFIYNIFEFEKIPLKLSVRKETVEWRLGKVFPESIDNYIHEYFLLDRKNVLSVLCRKKIIERVQYIAELMNKNMLYLGNSTIEIINNMRGKKLKRLKKSPDILFEIDKDLFVIIAQKRSVPFFLRKFRCANYTKNTETIVKNIDFLQKNNPGKLKNYYIISNEPQNLLEVIDQELKKRDLEKWNDEKIRNCFWLK